MSDQSRPKPASEPKRDEPDEKPKGEARPTIEPGKGLGPTR